MAAGGVALVINSTTDFWWWCRIMANTDEQYFF